MNLCLGAFPSWKQDFGGMLSNGEVLMVNRETKYFIVYNQNTFDYKKLSED